MATTSKTAEAKASTTSEKDTGENVEPQTDQEVIAETAISEPLATGTNYVETTEDAQGVRRIVSTYDDGWEPAPAEAPEAEVKAVQERQKAVEEAEDRNRERLQLKREDTNKSDKANG